MRGVRSAQARNNLMAMQKGDLVLFYHSQQEKSVVGILEVSKTAYPDPTSSDPKWLTCDFEPLQELAKPVSLSQIRECQTLKEIALIRQPRLAVMQLEEIEYHMILKLSKEATRT